jgi:ABC-2 type transport system permease protein
VVGWGVALVLAGAVFGSLADDVADMVSANPRLLEAVGAGSNNDLTDGFFAAAAQYLGLGVAAFAVASVLRGHGEEGAGRTEVVLAQLVRLPAVLVFAGLAVAVLGAAPRAASLVWLPVTCAVIVTFLGPLLRLPDWVPLTVLTVVAAGLVVVGLAGFRRRDVPTT